MELNDYDLLSVKLDLPSAFTPDQWTSVALDDFLKRELFYLSQESIPNKSCLNALMAHGLISDIPSNKEELIQLIYSCWNYMDQSFNKDDSSSRPYWKVMKSISNSSLDATKRDEYEKFRDILAFLLSVKYPSNKVEYNAFLQIMGGAESSLSLRNPEVQKRKELLIAQHVGSVQLLRDISARYPFVGNGIYKFLQFESAKYSEHVLLGALYTTVCQEIWDSQSENISITENLCNESYIDKALDPVFNPGGIYPEEIGHLLRLLDDPKIVSLLEQQYPDIFEGLSVHERLWVVRLLEGKKEGYFEDIHRLFQKFSEKKRMLIQVLQLCFQEDSEVIVKLLNGLFSQEDHEVIGKFIERSFQFVQIENEVRLKYGDDPVIGAFIQKISFKQGARFLQYIQDNGYDLAVADLPKFQQETVKTGALLKSIVKLRGSVDEVLLDKILAEDIKVSVVSSLEEGDLIDSNIFSSKDYDMVINSLRKSYSSEFNSSASDDSWLKYLESQLDCDLANPEVKWLFMRDSSGELMGVCKYKPLGKTKDGVMRFYWGTFYVAPEFQHDYSLGSYLQETVFDYMRKDADILGCDKFRVEGAVAPFNIDGLCRHVSGFDAVLDGVVTEGGSDLLFRVIWFSDGAQGIYETKKKQIWTKKKLNNLFESCSVEGQLNKVSEKDGCFVGRWNLFLPETIDQFRVLAEKGAVVTQIVPVDGEDGTVGVLIEEKAVELRE